MTIERRTAHEKRTMEQSQAIISDAIMGAEKNTRLILEVPYMQQIDSDDFLFYEERISMVNRLMTQVEKAFSAMMETLNLNQDSKLALLEVFMRSIEGIAAVELWPVREAMVCLARMGIIEVAEQLKSEDPMVVKRAKSFLLYYAALENNLMGIKTDSVLLIELVSADQKEFEGLSDIKIAVRFDDKAQLERLRATSLLNGDKIGPIKPMGDGNYFVLGD